MWLLQAKKGNKALQKEFFFLCLHFKGENVYKRIKMKKLVFLIATACLLVPAASFAQEVKRTEDDKTVTIVEETETPEGKIVTTTTIQKNSVFTNGFLHNWELMGGLGTQIYFGENDRRVNSFVEQFSFPTIDLYLTKWASPSFGVGLGATFSQFKGLYQGRLDDLYKVHFKTNDLYDYKGDQSFAYYQLTNQRGFTGNVFALAHVDLGNLFFGYNPSRFYTADAYAGGGILFGITDKAVGASFNVGLANKFRLTDRLSLLLNIRGALVSDDFDGESSLSEPSEEHYLKNIKLDGIAGGTLGLAWKLGKEKSKWERATRSSSIYYNDKGLAARDARIAELEKLLADADADKNNLLKQLQENEIQYVKDVPDLWFHINFIIDRWDLLSREKVNLQSVADIMKSTPNTRYLLCGYADKQTATPSHNLMLSKNRVETVYNFLTKELGVDPDQLVTDYKGGVDYMFYDEKELSRCCMITAIKEE